jgi:hypothetical protein
MAKGQTRSNREVRKPKKTDAEKVKKPAGQIATPVFTKPGAKKR